MSASTRSVTPGVIERLEDDICELCGEARELRPYGPNGESICHQCGMKDEAACRRAFDRLHDGEPN